MTAGIGSHAVRGTLWLGLVNLVSKGSQVVVTLVLAATLTEGGLGSVALAVAVVNIGQVIQAMGVYDVIGRTERDPDRLAGTVLTLSVGTGLALAAVLVAAAAPVAALLGAPDAAPLVRLAAVSLPFTAAGGVQMAVMHRRLDFRRRLLPDAGSAVLGAAVTVVLAVTGAGPVALVAGLLCTAVAQPVLGAVVGVPPRPAWDAGAAREALGWIAVVGPAALVAIVLVNVDYLAIGHVLGPAAVGVYSLAYRIAWVPYIMVAIVLAAVAFPVYTKLVRDGDRAALPAATARFTRATLVVTAGLYLVIALLADRVVLLGDRWAPATPVLVLLCAYGLAISLLQSWYQVIKAAGQARCYLLLEVTHLVSLGAALVLVTRHGMVAVAAAQVAAAWLLVVLTWCVLTRLALAFPTAELAAMTAAVLGAAVPCVAVAVLADRLFGPPGTVAGVLAEALALVVAYAGGSLLTQRAAVRELRALTLAGGGR
ncbi:oligosaccharide flippase family protein [Actinophytocola algeriensis]|uniref:PST family polysaccharide transporter n=1 Tax=Actinophytocola algeriensis TaxID=1768010 RepID=A0A7W7Q303_9PSEU|nr:oligosaccharide flippase family protein [Actinophytocola algeriensis]MBB4905948.1 PST family polysaccharide transporter [Actinophytocola algeriensis]MBE1472367.1 PST family polysaccharide transporter [Actinophytocola algeriensis]